MGAIDCIIFYLSSHEGFDLRHIVFGCDIIENYSKLLYFTEC